MMKNRFLASTLILSVVMALACSGLPGKLGGKRSGANLKVGASSIKRSGKRQKAPKASAVEGRRKKEEYTVKLAPGVGELKIGKRVITGNKKLDDSFGKLGLKDSSSLYSRHSPKNKRVAEVLGLGRTIHIRTARDPEEVVRRLSAHPDVEWVEPVSEVRNTARRGKKRTRASSGGGAPNDPYFDHQWHMKNLNVTEAWATTKGKGVVVAVVDTGVSKNEDGFFELLPGQDFVDNDSDASDLNGHGTHVAGTIGQKSDNGIGVAGVAPEVSILPVRVLDANGSGSNTWVANGILWAVDNGANIINLSLGSPMNSEVVSDACAYAYEQGVTVIAATGNDGFTDFIGFPAALDTTIAVGSVDLANKIAFYSNQGQQIDLVAPGGDTTADSDGNGLSDGVLQETIMNGQWSYYALQGTSMATPHVAGVAALVYANGVHDPDAIRSVLTSTAQDLGASGRDNTFGHGLVDPVAALGKKAPSTSGELITRHKVKELGSGRAVIGWMTSEPADTFVKGSNDFRRRSETPTKMHKVTVQGDPGQTVSFTLRSRAGERKDSKKITITF